jgi:hypothetical protein
MGIPCKERINVNLRGEDYARRGKTDKATTGQNTGQKMGHFAVGNDSLPHLSEPQSVRLVTAGQG